MAADNVTEAELEVRLEHELLLCEQDFLLRETEATTCISNRATTARKNAAETDIGLLRAYLEGMRRKNRAVCFAAEEGMRAKVLAAKRRSEELRRILSELQKETTEIRERCASISM
ncbi:hypothetical protein C3747_17g2560c [Trypanosoma cruzi]|uniref:Uncharacterized protein n=3 Tax=Trypanosoma cruzi TaxID=5693 RepID=Q4CYN7_TRYCC|nr:hypothetical protein, conserved [Trypanosoma cruzi]XP_808052.1 hypothetical protein, conserved [Trypanosoma cruzi]PBJ69419.1 hypothetical protein BCY84_19825 [Trypanosoma cruzi cruzi]EAN85386.1 hypothetical protein, conserved [Trypanosoma cruzi]EAN86201.1 hypothetical protein, conserved [Trypanosoma cruzi]KAF8281872.1 hypothetical protein TcYC6_0007200 [Trypanosoma cruzi]KAF8286602.1 hypothetical protein TcBrA4_0023890 [Trypanosoma cruzi]|eukprot:XP_807237.1 hypothetical protein [Trypanosoma cruzi strain CL Brener]